jgi:hypothetical protein
MNDRIIDLEDKISKIVFVDNKRTVHFEYSQQEFETPFNVLESGQPVYTKTKHHQVIAHTYNSGNRETFMLKSEVGSSYEECLEKIHNYILNHRKSVSTYTVVWCKKQNTKQETSYFIGSSVIEVINKFFDGKDPDEYIVYTIKMNPIS